MTMKAENGTMELEHLHIRRKASYETENAGRFVAEVKYKGKSGCVELLLDPEIAEALLGFIGPALSKAAGKAALEIERNIQIAVAEVQQPQIELGGKMGLGAVRCVLHRRRALGNGRAAYSMEEMTMTRAAQLRFDADKIDRGGGAYEALIPEHMREAAGELDWRSDRMKAAAKTLADLASLLNERKETKRLLQALAEGLVANPP